jgi:N6-L-threonylcarbamoyladenine synthase
MILGIDTSCYTTSLAVMDRDGVLIKDLRRVLTVKKGERGLQQSAALFQHLQNIPGMFQDLCREIDIGKIRAVCASSRPRPVEGSYMPVFTVGSGFGHVISEAREVPFYLTSHQEGHIMAGIWSSGGPKEKNFLAVHLSGGTSELLMVTKHPLGFNIEILGATGDLHAGQFIDRIGVEMGLPFPTGPYLEKLGEKYEGEIPYVPSAVQGYNFSFSGPETAARTLLKKGISQEAVARAVEHCISTTLEKVIRKAVQEYNTYDVLIVGGVAANTYIRKRLTYRLEHRAVGAKLYFAHPSYSSDNAVGIAGLGLLNK